VTKRVSDLAVFGGSPSFDLHLPVGQLNFPEWERIEKSFRAIFDRQWYTNHGPLTQELEQKLGHFFGVRHALCMTNATIGLLITAAAMEVKGKVLTPAYTFVATGQSLLWAGLEPVFCDVDPDTHLISMDRLESLVGPDIGAVLGVHLWGNPCNITELEQLTSRCSIPLFFDAAQAFGSEYHGRKVGQFGDAEVFSFHATKVFNSMEGGCVCTNDDTLAARIRNIRSSYGAGPPVNVPQTGNGRFSEAQAAMALLSLEDFPKNLARNRRFSALYRENLKDVPGIRWPSRLDKTSSNDQYIVIEIDEASFGLTRDNLCAILHAENVGCRRYFTPGVHRTKPFKEWFPQFQNSLPVTDRLCRSVMQLPSGGFVSDTAINTVCEIIRFVQSEAGTVRTMLKADPVAL
jgi:dTDP-4-amino-4,6-dideoxygalactose transaminase